MGLIENGFSGGTYLREMFSDHTLSIFKRKLPEEPIKADGVCGDLIAYLRTGKRPVMKDSMLYIDELIDGKS